MATTVQGLLKTPREKLVSELEQVRERERRLGQERELLERVLEILDEKSQPSRPAMITVGPLRKQILRVMRLRDPGVRWLPRQVQMELAGHGNDKVSIDNVRVTMRRMASAGELVKVPGKMSYELPPTGG